MRHAIDDHIYTNIYESFISLAIEGNYIRQTTIGAHDTTSELPTFRAAIDECRRHIYAICVWNLVYRDTDIASEGSGI